MSVVGYTVVEYRQVGGYPELVLPVLHEELSFACEDAEIERAHAREAGRGDKFAVAEVCLVEEPA